VSIPNPRRLDEVPLRDPDGGGTTLAAWAGDMLVVQLVRSPLLLDALQLGPIGARLLDPRGLVSYGRALRAGFRPQRITRDTVQAPGVVIVDTQGAVCWQHVGRRIGDYPPLADVIAAVRGIAGRGGE
jgi:hypothetical protein